MRLVVLAAGLGTRFGGPKQLTPVGPAGEVILDYALRDARASGFDELVIVTRSDLAAQVAARAPGAVIVCQDRDELARSPKPLGTAHAALCGMRAGGGGAAAVVNGDDLYSADAFWALASHLADGQSVGSALVTFPVSNTVLSDAPVTRALCTTAAGVLVDVEEGTVGAGTWVGVSGRRVELHGDEPVSMNCWAFAGDVADRLEAACRSFTGTGEVLLPDVVRSMLADGVRVSALRSGGRCIGLTHPGDLEAVRRLLAG
jgi:molybdopterin-guanine dinucleotide biosynthesis protein A